MAKRLTITPRTEIYALGNPAIDSGWKILRNTKEKLYGLREWKITGKTGLLT
jgi:hypothetical protein